METILFAIFACILLLSRDRNLHLENLALRQQLAIMKQKSKRPKIRLRDRIFWVVLSRFWKDWKSVLVVVKPETVINWHRKGFKLFWAYKSRKKGPGRPSIDSKTRKLIKKMAKANPLWGAPRIHGELLKLGYDVHERTISNIIKWLRPRKPPSQTWRTFLKNHMFNTYAVDLFKVPTANFQVLSVLVIIRHDTRQVVHFNITRHPTGMWAAQQIVEACPWDALPKYLLRDRDSIYSEYFQSRIQNMGINEVKTAPKSPWQNPYIERLIGSIRRDCINAMIILNEAHLRHILTEYLAYYHEDRTHLGLGKETPAGRSVSEKPENGKVVALSRLGGLHHRYEWQDAA
jgi:putative transposase